MRALHWIYLDHVMSQLWSIRPYWPRVCCYRLYSGSCIILIRFHRIFWFVCVDIFVIIIIPYRPYCDLDCLCMWRSFYFHFSFSLNNCFIHFTIFIDFHSSYLVLNDTCWGIFLYLCKCVVVGWPRCMNHK